MPIKILIIPFFVLAFSIVNAQTIDTKGIKDSIYFRPLGFVYGLRVADSLTETKGDTVIKTVLLKHVPFKERPIGVFYSDCDQVLTSETINGIVIRESKGCLSATDSFRFMKRKLKPF